MITPRIFLVFVFALQAFADIGRSGSGLSATASFAKPACSVEKFCDLIVAN